MIHNLFTATHLVKWITSDFVPHLGSNNNWDMCIGMKTRYAISLQAKIKIFCDVMLKWKEAKKTRKNISNVDIL